MSAYVLQAKGAYRMPSERLFSFAIFDEVVWAEGDASGRRLARFYEPLRRYSCRLTSCQDCPPSGESSVSVANPSAVSTR